MIRDRRLKRPASGLQLQPVALYSGVWRSIVSRFITTNSFCSLNAQAVIFDS